MADLDEYIVLTEDTLSLVLEKTHWPFSETAQLLAKAKRMHGKFAIFYFDYRWQRVFVANRYNTKQFMYKLKERLSYDVDE